jgi:anti-sigma-K factor RskA
MPESYVGLLTDATGKPAVLAASRRHGRELFVKLLQPVAVPPGKTLTLWALPKSGVPFRVGTLPGDGKVTLALPAESETLFKNVPRLAATLEPASNVPLTPSESYLLIGSCVKLW